MVGLSHLLVRPQAAPARTSCCGAGKIPTQVGWSLLQHEKVRTAKARGQQLSPAARLKLHQEESAPVMKELEAWMDKQINEKLAEPNSGLGKAIKYMTAAVRWEVLTRFLHVEDAPLGKEQYSGRW
jgi:hypothetical protein